MRNGTAAGLTIVSAAMLLASIAFFTATAASPGDAADAAEPEDNLGSGVIDIGIIASDVAASAAFYKDALGFTEIGGFEVPAAMSKDAGLTDGRAFKVRVFTAAGKDKATKLKLMAFPAAAPKKVETTYLSSSLGFRYITIFVNDTRAAVARAAQFGVTPVKEPYALADGKNFLTLVRDPDGNIIELIGPKL